MVADLREMQENQGFSENRIDKLEFVTLSCLYLLKQEFVDLCASDHNSLTMYVPPSSRL